MVEGPQNDRQPGLQLLLDAGRQVTDQLLLEAGRQVADIQLLLLLLLLLLLIAWDWVDDVALGVGQNNCDNKGESRQRGFIKNAQGEKKEREKGDAKNLCKGQRRAVSTEMMIGQ